jgi:hypothetical protein
MHIDVCCCAYVLLADRFSVLIKPLLINIDERPHDFRKEVETFLHLLKRYRCLLCYLVTLKLNFLKLFVFQFYVNLVAVMGVIFAMLKSLPKHNVHYSQYRENQNLTRCPDAAQLDAGELAT